MNTSLLVKSMIGAAIAVIALGCGEPAKDDPAYKAGDLGKGGFLFGCADGVACRTFFSSDSERFPKGLASGSTFGIRFVANEDMGDAPTITFDDLGTEYKGTHVEGLTPFFGKAPGLGIAALRPGIGTLVARTSDGTLIDTTSITISKTTKLVVYDADDDKAVSVTAITLDAGGGGSGKRLRIVGQAAGGQNLAGSISHSWTFDPPDVASVDSKNDGVSTFVGEKVGKTTATVTGAGVTATISIEVK
ncbi:MAG: hypothetical protein U0270_00105 [Labilithrix sp.]